MKIYDRKIRRLARAKKFTEALALLDTIPEQYMTPEMLVKRGIFIQLEDETLTYELSDAEESFKKALALNPYNIDALIELGYFLYAVMDDAVGAEPYFRKAVALIAKQQSEAVTGVAKCLSEIKGEQASLDFIKTTRLSSNEKRKLSAKIRD